MIGHILIFWAILGIIGFLMLMLTKKRYIFLSEMVALFSTSNILVFLATAMFYYTMLPLGILSAIVELLNSKDDE